MIKIFMTVRNRLEITKKAIHALKIHSTIPHQIYIYNNSTNHLLDKHFVYFMKLYEKKFISQITFTSNETTFNAFSKASTCNFFGSQHLHDPNRDSYQFLVMIDNDIVVTPEWDKKLLTAWNYVNKQKINNIKVIGQLPGGIKKTDSREIKITEEMKGRVGKYGGSGLWSVKPNFFQDVGFLNLKTLVGQNKKHDQLYWHLLEKSTNGKPYIMGINQKLGIHCGKMAGSVCNRLTQHGHKKDVLDIIKFDEYEKRLEKINFDDFFKMIENDEQLLRDW